MARRFVDLSVPIENDVRSDPPGLEPSIEYRTHKETAPLVARRYAELKRAAWGFDTPPRAHASALLPMGGAVSGVAGPNWMLVGDILNGRWAVAFDLLLLPLDEVNMRVGCRR
jgi:hypothetical protein